MNRIGQRWSFSPGALACIAMSAIALSACGGAKIGGPGGKTDAGTGSSGDLTLTLTRIGTGTLSAHPGDVVSLNTLLLATNGTSIANAVANPVPNVSVTWKITEMPCAVSFSATSTDTVSTDTNGLAATSVTLGDNCTGSNLEVKIVASAPGATTSAQWIISPTPVIINMQILPTLGVDLVNPQTANAATVESAVNTSVNFQVLVTAQNGGGTQTPIPNAVVSFSFSSATPSAAFPNNMTTATETTDGSGTTPPLTLSVGSTTGTEIIVAQTPNAQAVTFTVTVSATPPTCVLSSQCGTGEVCVGGVCTGGMMTGTSGSCGDNDQMCPIGYQCSPTSNTCVPITTTTCDQSMCPVGYTCDSSTNPPTCVPNDPQCSTTMPCPSGSTCMNGVCYPDSGGQVDVTGHWYTEHDFDVHDALPTGWQDAGAIVRLLDEILMGQIPQLPSIVNAIIRGIVQQYVPNWVTTIFYLLDNIFTIFSDLRAKGEMDITAVGGPDVLHGVEAWDSFVFYLLAQCGQNIGTLNLNQPPACAEVDVYTSNLAQAQFSTVVDPCPGSNTMSCGFNATLNGDQLLMNRRSVNLQMAGIIEYVINQVISTTTGYSSLQGTPGNPNSGALEHLIDCRGLAQSIMQAGIPFDVTSLCQAFVAAAAQQIANWLGSITIGFTGLTFTGQASALCTSALDHPCGAQDPSYAQGLGFPDWETRSPADGIWTGDFIGLVGHVPGRWRAARRPW